MSVTNMFLGVRVEKSPVKVFVTGTRGVPDIPGGVEKHCEQLYPLIAERDLEVMLSRRSCYVIKEVPLWKGIQLVDLFAPRKKSLEAIIHTTLSIFRAKRWGADIVHIHAVGPAIMTPLGRLLGMKVVVTNHGPDYDRQKWGWLARSVLRLGEYLGCKYANEVIVISEPIREIVQRRCGSKSNLIYNGVPIPELKQDSDYLETLDLEKGKYLLAVSRLVPEKGLHDLVDAFESGMDSDLKLVIAGDSDHKDDYSQGLKVRASENPNIVMPGYVTGRNLEQLFTHARLFVLTSYHEGLPIALLEALSYGLPTVVSDIPANLEVNLQEESYFPVGNVTALRERISSALNKSVSQAEREETRNWVGNKYNWSNIADQTVAVYERALNSS